MTELSKILKDEAYLESEKRGVEVPLFDDIVYQRAVKIWEEIHEKQSEKVLDIGE